MDLPTETDRLQKLHPTAEVHRQSMMGLGYLYSAGAVMMGETALQAGKVMGLSAYGQDTNQTHIKDDLFVDDMMFHCRDVNLFFYGYGPDNFIDIAQEIFGKKGVDVTDEITKHNYQPYADYAKAVQKDTQNVIIRLVRKALDKTGIKKLCFTGGYAMNIITNTLLVETFPDVEFYFEPMATDVGISVGTAMYHWRINTKDNQPRPLTTTAFHGWKYDVSQFRGLVATASEVAKLLERQKSVAVYDGYSEAGQRALGNRSILFNPLVPNAREIVNRIKKREWYRPFAACVLEEDAHLYFNIKQASRFMTQCYKVTTDIIPGVTHVDGTCRVQTVVDGHLYEILQQFKKRTGHGILLNTSFNLAGNPLVETPEQAFDTLAQSELDYLWFPETLQLFS
jgi:carbamoyltransferase